MAVLHVQKALRVSGRRACKTLGQPRSTQRKPPVEGEFEARLRQLTTDMALQYGRYGYRRITALLRREGWDVNHKRIERIWRQEGLKVPKKQPNRGRLWFNDGRKLRMQTVIDEYTTRCLAVRVERRLCSGDVLDCLADLMIEHGVPGHIRSDKGSEFTAKAVRDWIDRVGARTLFIEPGSPWENGYNESFNGKLRDELLTGEISYTLQEAKVLIERWRWEYNHFRPHSSLGYRPPAPEAWLPADVAVRAAL